MRFRFLCDLLSVVCGAAADDYGLHAAAGQPDVATLLLRLHDDVLLGVHQHSYHTVAEGLPQEPRG